MKIAVTGGAGYIGSHTVVALIDAGHDVLILDNFANSERDIADRIEAITSQRIHLHQSDVTDPDSYRAEFRKFGPDAVIHFAGLKAVGEAVVDPLEYFRVNLGGSVALFQVMEDALCHRLVFSSSATVYGEPLEIPIPENHRLEPTNPYGASKRMVEQVIEDWGRASSTLAAVNLRYFNPVGAHASALIGEAPKGVPQNLMPFVAQVAQGVRDEVLVFGDNWPTPDGTGVRDYIHVVDLAAAHLAALDLTMNSAGVQALNIGTGRGYSVLEMIRAFETASGQDIAHRVVDRRAGDIATSVADASLALKLMGWSAERDLEDMCRDAWAWQKGRNH